MWRALGRCVRNRGGFSLAEPLIACVVIPVVIGGTMAGYTVAARLQRAHDDAASTEAMGYARQLLEEVRNRVAADDPWWAAQAASGWQSVPFAGNGTQTISGQGAARLSCVTAQDCDGDAVIGDCYAMQVKVCWDGTACPAVGEACP